jgi:hypothetical protein
VKQAKFRFGKRREKPLATQYADWDTRNLSMARFILGDSGQDPGAFAAQWARAVLERLDPAHRADL